MMIGVPKEIKDQEYRVALLPSAAYQLIKRGHKVVVEHKAGAGIGYGDADYESAGASLLSTHRRKASRAEQPRLGQDLRSIDPLSRGPAPVRQTSRRCERRCGSST